MEEFLVSNRLYVINEANSLPTFETTNGQSNINITLIREGMIGFCTDWTVSSKCTTSDHNLIIFNVLTKPTVNVLTKPGDLRLDT